MYAIELLIVAQDMLTTCEIFYDFITGEVINEQIREQYFEDIVALEQRREYRSIPLTYAEQAETLEIPDAPTFSIILSSGDRTTVTFASRAYYLGIITEIVAQSQSIVNVNQSELDERLRESSRAAYAALAALRRHVRDHKRGRK